jgi:hypothetical protein
MDVNGTGDVGIALRRRYSPLPRLKLKILEIIVLEKGCLRICVRSAFWQTSLQREYCRNRSGKKAVAGE